MNGMKKLTLLTFILSSILVTAQRNLTIEEATLTAQKGFAPQTVYSPQWRTNEALTYMAAPYNALTETRINGENMQRFFTVEEINTVLSEKLNKEIHLSMMPFSYQWESENEYAFTYADDASKYYIIYNIELKKITKWIPYGGNAKEEEVAADKSFVVWLDENNIKVSFENGSTISITNDTEGIVNGSSNTHREEFGVNKGFWISPDSKKILFYKKDEQMVADYPLTDFSVRIAENKPFKYPMAGMKSEEVTLHIYSIERKNSIKLAVLGDKEQFLTMPTWSPNSDFVYTGVLNRGQNHLKLQRYHAASGQFDKQLFEEKSNTYVEPSHSLKFINNQEFIYITDKEGFRQMYRYNTNGKQLNSYVFNDVVFKNFVEVNPNEIYYIGTANQGLDKLLYRTNINSGKTTVVSRHSGTYNVEMNPSNTWYYAQFSNFEKPNIISLNTIKGNKSIEILNAKNPFEGKVNLPKVELITLKAADGKTTLNGRLTYPVDFNENHKYPVMIYVYGGPHAQLVTNRFNGGANGFDYYMAQQGFVVFTLDNRGSDNRGKDFEHVIHRELGKVEMLDQMEGVAFLKTKNFVDTDRIGVYGWSYGGFMATGLMLNYPEIFKVGVAGGPVIDWKWYEVMYGERYMDTPDENPEGYAKTSLLDKAHQLEGRLLLIHGAQDPVVVQQHSMSFIEACIKAGKQIDYFLYPTHEHNVFGRDRIHLNEKIADYFITHLKN